MHIFTFPRAKSDPMKKFPSLPTLLLVIVLLYIGFSTLKPGYRPDADAPKDQFSTDRAMALVQQLAQEPHAVGFPAHEQVREYLVQQLQALGLEPQLQTGYTVGDWANLSRATNIMAKIKGTGQGKALLLLSHYDSNPHSSLGASDDGAGVATILEGLRAFMEQHPTPKNDIIVLFTDAEELGLNGADLFVNQHPWAKEVGLVLNFEARGSGGPSYMLLETNGGNAKLIDAFTEADPAYPAANSLMYSVYKMLPNDTDLTVFREDGNINGFNFAFIGDHFDYHTALDRADRLDPETLAHQGQYLMPLLTYFSNADLTDLNSPNDRIYFNFPLFHLVSYPFSWIWPLFGLGVLGFLIFIGMGAYKRRLQAGQVFLGFLPLLAALFVNGALGYFAWPLLKAINPGYRDVLHGFSYNGYTYILAMVFLSVAICFWSYARFRKLELVNLLVAPIALWLIINLLVGLYLPGAAFLILPTLGLLLSALWICCAKKVNPLLLVVLAIPVLWILGPFVKMFPVGLGLKMLIAATLCTTLLFGLLLPVVAQYRSKGALSGLSIFLFLVTMVWAQFQSGFTEDRPKPTSLVYLYNADNQKAQWATYDQKVGEWTAQYLPKKTRKPAMDTPILPSKYRTGFSYTAPAPKKELAAPSISKTLDTIVGHLRTLELTITPQRHVNRLDIFTPFTDFTSVKANGIDLKKDFLKERGAGKLLTHFITADEPTVLQMQLPINAKLELSLYETSNDLLTNPLFSIPARPKDNIPMPFVANDAIMVYSTVALP